MINSIYFFKGILSAKEFDSPAIAGKGDELLDNPDVGRLFLGG